MADPRRLAAALAPFHEARTHLEAAQARLSALLAAVTGEAAARTGNLERLPAALCPADIAAGQTIARGDAVPFLSFESLLY